MVRNPIGMVTPQNNNRGITTMNNVIDAWLSGIEQRIKNYHGRIWGELPDDFPMIKFEKIYRYCIEMIGAEEYSVRLMGMGFAGVAYRYRTLAENDEIFTTSIKQDGYGPPIEEGYYKQISSQFAFFTAGFSCIESFFFAMHALASYYKPDSFDLCTEALSRVGWSQVKDQYNKHWKETALASTMSGLVASTEFNEWKEIRNILSHRVEIPREIIFHCSNGNVSANLLREKAGSKGGNISLNEFTISKRRLWLSDQIMELVDSLVLFAKQYETN